MNRRLALRTAIITILLLTPVKAATPAPCNFEGHPQTAAQLLACALRFERAVTGTQQFRYSRARDLRPGQLIAELEELTLVGPDQLQIAVSNAWGRYRYQFSALGRQPNARSAQALPASGRVKLAELRWADLARLTPAHRPQLRGQIDRVEAQGRVLIGRFAFAGEDIDARLVLTDETDGGPQPAARWHNIPYGPHWQQTIDFYPALPTAPGSAATATEATARPLVIAIHGGGWGALDKDNTFGLQASLPQRGIHVASINYRFIHTAPEQGLWPPVRMPLEDAARALQTLRWLADELKIDPARIGAVGGSAGGFTALWLALHQDMADPDSPDPIARQSTRLQAAAGIDAQTSLDPAQMRAWIPTINYGAHAFGIYDPAGRAAAFATWLGRRDQLLGQIERYSPYALAAADAPPIHLSYPERGLTAAPGESGWAAHAPQFGVQLHQRLQGLGVESYLHHKAHTDPGFGADYAAFLIEILTRAPESSRP